MSATQVTVTSMQVAVRYRRNVGSISIDMSAYCRTTTFGRHIDRVSVEISADIPVDMSVNKSTDTSRSIHRPSVGRHVDDISVEMSTNISVEGCPKYTRSLITSHFYSQADIMPE